MRYFFATTLLTGSLCGAPANAIAGVEPAAALKPAIACRSLTSDEARLRCYDKAVQELAERAATGSILIMNREEVKQARRAAFGLTLPKIPFFDNAPTKEDEPEELVAAIRSARSLAHGKWELNLDAAGVWQTTEALSSAKIPKQGQEIQITKGMLGSYFIRMADGRTVKGLRVR
jgi:hypothetical protein